MGVGSSASQTAKVEVVVKERYHAYLPKQVNMRAMLTPEKVKLVHAHWNFIADEDDAGMMDSRSAIRQSRISVFYDAFYEKLFEKAPSAKKLFDGNMVRQSRALVKMVSWLCNLEASEDLKPKLEALADRHVEYGCLPLHYEAGGEALRHALAAVTRDQDPKETELTLKAWEDLYTFVILVVIPRTALRLEETIRTSGPVPTMLRAAPMSGTRLKAHASPAPEGLTSASGGASGEVGKSPQREATKANAAEAAEWHAAVANNRRSISMAVQRVPIVRSGSGSFTRTTGDDRRRASRSSFSRRREGHGGHTLVPDVKATGFRGQAGRRSAALAAVDSPHSADSPVPMIRSESLSVTRAYGFGGGARESSFVSAHRARSRSKGRKSKILKGFGKLGGSSAAVSPRDSIGARARAVLGFGRQVGGLDSFDLAVDEEDEECVENASRPNSRPGSQERATPKDQDDAGASVSQSATHEAVAGVARLHPGVSNPEDENGIGAGGRYSSSSNGSGKAVSTNTSTMTASQSATTTTSSSSGITNHDTQGEGKGDPPPAQPRKQNKRGTDARPLLPSPAHSTVSLPSGLSQDVSRWGTGCSALHRRSKTTSVAPTSESPSAVFLAPADMTWSDSASGGNVGGGEGGERPRSTKFPPPSTTAGQYEEDLDRLRELPEGSPVGRSVRVLRRRGEGGPDVNSMSSSTAAAAAVAADDNDGEHERRDAASLAAPGGPRGKDDTKTVKTEPLQLPASSQARLESFARKGVLRARVRTKSRQGSGHANEGGEHQWNPEWEGENRGPDSAAVETAGEATAEAVTGARSPQRDAKHWSWKEEEPLVKAAIQLEVPVTPHREGSRRGVAKWASPSPASVRGSRRRSAMRISSECRKFQVAAGPSEEVRRSADEGEPARRGPRPEAHNWEGEHPKLLPARTLSHEAAAKFGFLDGHAPTACERKLWFRRQGNSSGGEMDQLGANALAYLEARDKGNMHMASWFAARSVEAETEDTESGRLSAGRGHLTWRRSWSERPGNSSGGVDYVEHIYDTSVLARAQAADGTGESGKRDLREKPRDSRHPPDVDAVRMLPTRRRQQKDRDSPAREKGGTRQESEAASTSHGTGKGSSLPNDRRVRRHSAELSATRAKATLSGDTRTRSVSDQISSGVPALLQPGRDPLPPLGSRTPGRRRSASCAGGVFSPPICHSPFFSDTAAGAGAGVLADVTSVAVGSATSGRSLGSSGSGGRREGGGERGHGVESESSPADGGHANDSDDVAECGIDASGSAARHWTSMRRASAENTPPTRRSRRQVSGLSKSLLTASWDTLGEERTRVPSLRPAGKSGVKGRCTSSSAPTESPAAADATGSPWVSLTTLPSSRGVMHGVGDEWTNAAMAAAVSEAKPALVLRHTAKEVLQRSDSTGSAPNILPRRHQLQQHQQRGGSRQQQGGGHKGRRSEQDKVRVVERSNNAPMSLPSFEGEEDAPEPDRFTGSTPTAAATAARRRNNLTAADSGSDDDPPPLTYSAGSTPGRRINPLASLSSDSDLGKTDQWELDESWSSSPERCERPAPAAAKAAAGCRSRRARAGLAGRAAQKVSATWAQASAGPSAKAASPAVSTPATEQPTPSSTIGTEDAQVASRLAVSPVGADVDTLAPGVREIAADLSTRPMGKVAIPGGKALERQEAEAATTARRSSTATVASASTVPPVRWHTENGAVVVLPGSNADKSASVAAARESGRWAAAGGVLLPIKAAAAAEKSDSPVPTTVAPAATSAAAIGVEKVSRVRVSGGAPRRFSNEDRTGDAAMLEAQAEQGVAAVVVSSWSAPVSTVVGYQGENTRGRVAAIAANFTAGKGNDRPARASVGGPGRLRTKAWENDASGDCRGAADTEQAEAFPGKRAHWRKSSIEGLAFGNVRDKASAWGRACKS